MWKFIKLYLLSTFFAHFSRYGRHTQFGRHFSRLNNLFWFTKTHGYMFEWISVVIRTKIVLNIVIVIVYRSFILPNICYYIHACYIIYKANVNYCDEAPSGDRWNIPNSKYVYIFCKHSIKVCVYMKISLFQNSIIWKCS